MTNEEASNILDDYDVNFEGHTAEEVAEAFDVAFKALEQQEKTAAMTRYTDGLEEGIRCAMCTNPMANDRGCDGGCVVNESMYQNVLNVIKKHFLEQEPCENCISREEALMALTGDITDCTVEEYIARLRNRLSKLPSVTPKEKTGKWDVMSGEIFKCSECKQFSDKVTDFCSNCGARMGMEVEE